MTKQDFISHGITMKKQDKLYDVYVSYPPDVDRERINACLYDNLPEKEAEDLVQALAERPQAIIAENCTQDERENAQQYFNYLGLDVIVRQSMELELDLSGEEQEEAAPEIRQCPVCLTLIEDHEAAECPVCHFHLASATEQIIQRKRIEWQERVAFEHKKQAEIAHKLQIEKEREEKLLRKQIRSELESKLRQELGEDPQLAALQSKKNTYILISVLGILAMFGLVAAGYLAAKFL